jgi:hypothetical protein
VDPLPPAGSTTTTTRTPRRPTASSLPSTQGGGDRPQERPECCRLGVAQLVQLQHAPAGQHDEPPGLGRAERVRDPPVGVKVYAVPGRRVRPPLEGAAEAIALLFHGSNCQCAGASCHPVCGPRGCRPSCPKACQPAGGTGRARSPRREGAPAPRTRSRKATDFDGLVTPDRRLCRHHLRCRWPMRQAQNAQFWCMLSMALRPHRGMSMPRERCEPCRLAQSAAAVCIRGASPQLVLCGGLRGRGRYGFVGGCP